MLLPSVLLVLVGQTRFLAPDAFGDEIGERRGAHLIMPGLMVPPK